MDVEEQKIVTITLKNVAQEPYVVVVHDIFELVHLNGVKAVYVCPRPIKNGLFSDICIEDYIF